MKNRYTADQLRELFETREAMEAVAYTIAEDQIDLAPSTYLDIEHIPLDDDPDHPTVIIMAAEKWQGNQENHALVLSLDEFVQAMNSAE